MCGVRAGRGVRVEGGGGRGGGGGQSCRTGWCWEEEEEFIECEVVV